LTQLLGIDFSGSAEQWSAGRRNSNVWIAAGQPDGARLRIDELKPVQALDGAGAPFDRLLALVATAKGFAGIDAPFSLPREHAASAGMLWAQAARLPQAGRPFGRGADLLGAVLPDPGKYGRKSYRACEEVWRGRGLAVRSALWNGPRGGAALAVACMTLLQRSGAPAWPLRSGGEGAVLVEAYPAAQLLAWGLSPTGYNGPKPAAAAARSGIVDALVGRHGLSASDAALAVCRANADALDAVICAYAAKTIAEGRHPRRLPSEARSEGWIVVDESADAAAAPLLGAAAEHRARRHLDALAAMLAENGGGGGKGG
jgi:hypothetical protein